jgi:hypothetical protein
MYTPRSYASFEHLDSSAFDCTFNYTLTSFLFRAKTQAVAHSLPAPVPVPAPATEEPSSLQQPERRRPSPDPPLLIHSESSVPSGTTAVQSKQSPPIAESQRVHEEPFHEETIVPSQDSPTSHTIKEEPCRQATSSPQIGLQTALPNSEPDECSLALIHSLKNEVSRRVQPARYRPFGASDATTEGVDSSIIEAAEKARTIKPIIPHGTKFLLYNGPARVGEKKVKWELSPGQRAGYYGEKNCEVEGENVPVTEYWEIEGWDALAEGEDDDDGNERGGVPVITNGTTFGSPASVVSAGLASPTI